MSGLAYVGRDAATPSEIVNRRVNNTLISTATPNQISVQAQVNALTTGSTPTYASKSYVDVQDATFQLPSYYTTQDALNVPNTAIGQPSGVAALDGLGDVPIAQMPVLGAGYIQGPYGVTATFTGSTSNTPFKIADWNIGLTSLSFRPLVFMQCFILGQMSHPIIEVRIANSTTAVSYASGTLVARGQGRALYNDYHAISVWPAPNSTGQTPTNLGPNYNVWLSAWLYDANAQTVTIANGGVATGAAFLLRGAQ